MSDRLGTPIESRRKRLDQEQGRMKTGMWLAVAFNVAAIAILAAVTISAGNGAVAQSPYASAFRPLPGPVETVLEPIERVRPDSMGAASLVPSGERIEADSSRIPPASTPDPSPIPWIESADGRVRWLP